MKSCDYVRVLYHELVIPLLQWFRCENNCTFTKFSMLENFFSYIRNKKATVLSQLSKLSKRSNCSEWQLEVVATESGKEPDDYLQQLFHGGEVHQILRVFFSKPLALLTLFH